MGTEITRQLDDGATVTLGTQALRTQPDAPLRSNDPQGNLPLPTVAIDSNGDSEPTRGEDLEERSYLLRKAPGGEHIVTLRTPELVALIRRIPGHDTLQEPWAEQARATTEPLQDMQRHPLVVDYAQATIRPPHADEVAMQINGGDDAARVVLIYGADGKPKEAALMGHVTDGVRVTDPNLLEALHQQAEQVRQDFAARPDIRAALQALGGPDNPISPAAHEAGDPFINGLNAGGASAGRDGRY